MNVIADEPTRIRDPPRMFDIRVGELDRQLEEVYDVVACFFDVAIGT